MGTVKKYVDYDNEAYIWEKTKNKFVAKETGKGLSEANYTQEEKAKLANIQAGAEANVNADWDAVTGDAAILNKPQNLVQDANYVHITVDGAVSDVSNNPISNSIIKAYVDSAISSVAGLQFEKVTTLPATGENGVIYLVPNSGSTKNSFDEYVWITVDGTSDFEKIGTTDVDLSGYVLSSELIPLTTAEIDAICI